MPRQADYLFDFCLLNSAIDSKIYDRRHYKKRSRGASSRFDRDDAFDFDRNLMGQHDIADGRTGVAAGIAEHFDEKIGTAIDDLRRVVEVRRGIDHTEELDNEVDAVERAQRIAHGGEKAEADQPRAPVSLVNVDIDAELSGQLLAVGIARALAGEIKNVSGKPIRQIIGHRLAELRQHNAELFYACFRTHDLLLQNFDLQSDPQPRRQFADDAAPKRQHADHEYRALNDQHPLAERGQVVFHGNDQKSADDRAENRAESADQGHQHYLARHRPMHVGERGELKHQRLERSRQSRQCRREHESNELVVI